MASAIIGALALTLTVAGCTNDDLAKQYAAGSNKNYIAGSGVTELTPADRDKAISFTGVTEDGSHLASGDYLGKVLVINFWYADCPPCRAESADLQKLNSKYSAEGVDFLGVNTRNSAGTVRSFDKEFHVAYPSIIDVNGGGVQLAFSGSMAPNATPTTFVLDTQGRIAARISGSITDQPSTLDTLIKDTLAESN